MCDPALEEGICLVLTWNWRLETHGGFVKTVVFLCSCATELLRLF